MKHPVELGGVAAATGLVELCTKEFECTLVGLIDGQRLPKEHYVLDGLQLGHVTGKHEREQIDQ